MRAADVTSGQQALRVTDAGELSELRLKSAFDARSSIGFRLGIEKIYRYGASEEALRPMIERDH